MEDLYTTGASDSNVQNFIRDLAQYSREHPETGAGAMDMMPGWGYIALGTLAGAIVSFVLSRIQRIKDLASSEGMWTKAGFWAIMAIPVAAGALVGMMIANRE